MAQIFDGVGGVTAAEGGVATIAGIDLDILELGVTREFVLG